MTTQIQWWKPPTKAPDTERMTFADLWDALFGRRLKFTRVQHIDGGWYICTPAEASQEIDNANEYTLSAVRMTQRQFDALPEFEGF